MKLTLDTRPGIHLIRAYGRGEIRVNDQLLRTHCIVTADALIENWTARAPDALTVEDLQPIFDTKPDLVLLGTGAAQRFPPLKIRSLFTERRIGLEAMDLGAACRTFNVLVQEDRRVTAALFVD